MSWFLMQSGTAASADVFVIFTGWALSEFRPGSIFACAPWSDLAECLLTVPSKRLILATVSGLHSQDLYGYEATIT